MNHDNGRIRVVYYPPRFAKPVEIYFDLGEDSASCYRPLPRDRELYDAPILAGAFSLKQREEARKQLFDRAKLTAYLVPRLTKALVDAITAQDPVNGYEPGD